jgi:hypothetical protein
MKRTILPIISSVCLLVGTAAQGEILYLDNFDNDSLAVNTNGVGGGAVNNTLQAHVWVDDGDATFVTSGTSYTRRALLYSENIFQSDTGFKLTVQYTTGSVGDLAAHNFSFGLVRSDADLSTYSEFNPFKVNTNVYSLGVNLTIDDDVSAQGLNFTDGLTRTTLDQSGTRAEFKAGEPCEVTLEFGEGGYWCYRIDGVYEASGIWLEGFDLSNSYHVVVYGQDDHGGGKSIQSIKLETAYAPGERAAGMRGTWAGGGGIVWQVKDFKTLDTMGVGFNTGASTSANHTAPNKLLEMLWGGDVDENGDPINLVVPLWGDLSLDEPENDATKEKIEEIREAGFKVKAYSNAENFVGNNADAYLVIAERWRTWCDTNVAAQAFINSQPFHTAAYDSATGNYTDTSYTNRPYMFCYAEFVLKDYALRYGPHIGAWIFDSADDLTQSGDSATSGLIEEQRIFQAFANAIHAGNPEIPIAFNNGRSTLNYPDYPFAHATRFDDFTFGHAFGGNNDHASTNTGTFARNYRHIQRMMDTDGYVHDGGAWEWDDLIVGNMHSKLATTSWNEGPNQAWEQADFNQWNLEAMTAGGSLTWDGSTYTSEGVTQLRTWAYDLLKAMDDHLAANQNPGAPNWARYYTVLPDAVLGQAYYHVLEEEKDLWDPEGDGIAAVSPVDGAPSWLNISEDPLNSGHWILSGIPTGSAAVELSFALDASDTNNMSRTRKVELLVNENPEDLTPDVSGQPFWVSESIDPPVAYKFNEYRYTLIRGREFEDVDADPLSLEKVSGASWLTLDKLAPDVWQLRGTPTAVNAGLHTVELSLNDGTTTVKTFVQIEVTDAKFLAMKINSINGGAYWTNLEFAEAEDDLVYDNRSNNYDYRSVAYSTQAFLSDGGFRLSVEYTTGTIDDSLGHNFSFGLIGADTDLSTYAGFNPFSVDTNVYSLGVNVTAAQGVDSRGLNFTDGSVCTTLDQSGDNVQFVEGSSTPVVIEIRPNGAWTYSINGITEASGVIPGGFDLSKSYHVAFYGQDDHGGGKSIQSMSLELLHAPGSYAAWIADFGLSIDDALAHADLENGGLGDGYDNFAEYALGMDPTNADAGSRDWISVASEGGTNWVEYVHHRRSDYAGQGLSYLLIDSTNLVDSVAFTNAQDQIFVGPAVDGYEPVTNRYLTDESEKFIKLRIRQD